MKRECGKQEVLRGQIQSLSYKGTSCARVTRHSSGGWVGLAEWCINGDEMAQYRRRRRHLLALGSCTSREFIYFII